MSAPRCSICASSTHITEHCWQEPPTLAVTTFDPAIVAATTNRSSTFSQIISPASADVVRATLSSFSNLQNQSDAFRVRGIHQSNFQTFQPATADVVRATVPTFSNLSNDVRGISGAWGRSMADSDGGIGARGRLPVGRLRVAGASERISSPLPVTGFRPPEFGVPRVSDESFALAAESDVRVRVCGLRSSVLGVAGGEVSAREQVATRSVVTCVAAGAPQVASSGMTVDDDPAGSSCFLRPSEGRAVVRCAAAPGGAPDDVGAAVTACSVLSRVRRRGLEGSDDLAGEFLFDDDTAAHTGGRRSGPAADVRRAGSSAGPRAFSWDVEVGVASADRAAPSAHRDPTTPRADTRNIL